MYSPCLCDLLKVELKIKLLSVKMIKDTSTAEDDKNEAADLIVLEAEEENEILEETRKPEEDLKLKGRNLKTGVCGGGTTILRSVSGLECIPPTQLPKTKPQEISRSSSTVITIRFCTQCYVVTSGEGQHLKIRRCPG